MKNGQDSGGGSGKRRGRPSGRNQEKLKTAVNRPTRREETRKKKIGKGKAAALVIEEDVGNPGNIAQGSRLSAFSQLLRSLIAHDHAERIRVTRELKVTENTLYRWMNGTSKPHMTYLKSLPDVFPTHRPNMIKAINQTFPGTLDFPIMTVTPVDRDIYARVTYLVSIIQSPDVRLKEVALAIFEHILRHLDGVKGGLLVTYAALMPPREDGFIHSLYEITTLGSAPWSLPGIRSRAFLGSNSLAGAAARSLRMQIWDSLKDDLQLAVQVDDYEVSACAFPVMKGGLIAGVLIISSAQSGFFDSPTVCEAGDEYARMVALALRDEDFYPYNKLALRLMPPLKLQHTLLAETLVERSIQLAQNLRISHNEATKQALSEMESELELMALVSFESK